MSSHVDIVSTRAGAYSEARYSSGHTNARFGEVEPKRACAEALAEIEGHIAPRDRCDERTVYRIQDNVWTLPLVQCNSDSRCKESLFGNKIVDLMEVVRRDPQSRELALQVDNVSLMNSMIPRPDNLLRLNDNGLVASEPL